MEKGREKRIISVLMTLTIIFTLMGGTLSYLRWQTSEGQKTNVVFTVNQDFSCAADGGGNIESASLMPASCTNEKYAIQRTVTVTPTINRDDLSISMDLWLDINVLGSGLSQSEYFRYALTTVENDCTKGIISQGRFTGLSSENNDKVMLLNQQEYSASEPQTYYLYIWIDPLEENNYIVDQSFNFSLGGNCTDTPKTKPSKPELDSGMIPVTISDTGVVTTISENDESWYDYESKEWANVVLVDSSSRSTYQNTTGKIVLEDDILAYYVWIPRYKYLIPESKMSCSSVIVNTFHGTMLDFLEKHPEQLAFYLPECLSVSMTNDDKNAAIAFIQTFGAQNGIEFSKERAIFLLDDLLINLSVFVEEMGMTLSLEDFVTQYNYYNETPLTFTPFVNGNKKTNAPTTIDIYFESKDSLVETGDAVNTYRTHPSFIWDGQAVGGIWVGKFGITGEVESPTIKPNIEILDEENVSTLFTTSLKFAGGTLIDGLVDFVGGDTYGLSSKTDSHLMKNSEWGAVVYLSHSKYGINDKIAKNNHSIPLSGCGVSRETDVVVESICEIPYGTPLIEINSYPQSTTGNITGIFDMSGGSTEYVMGVFSDSNVKPLSGNSGFSIFPESKYYDLYLDTQFYGDGLLAMSKCTMETCGGHALNETAGWYADGHFYFVDYGSPWFTRGGVVTGYYADGVFNFASGTGESGMGHSVLVVEDGV